MEGLTFETITDLNEQALEWCSVQNFKYYDEIENTAIKEHNSACAQVLTLLAEDPKLFPYLMPERSISFDGFVTFEGRRFGVPYRYHGRTVRVQRAGDNLKIYSSDCQELLVTHKVSWSRKDQFCEDQYIDSQPEELPTAPIKVMIEQKPSLPVNAFDKFDFGGEDF